MDQGLLQVIIIYFLVINLVTFITYGIDKLKAKRSKWRISEATLLSMAIVGGSIGAWLGMKAWHHKTLHMKFKSGIPVIIFLQLLAVGYLIYSREWN